MGSMRLKLGLAMSAAATCVGSPAWAQAVSETAGASEFDIVVTARKREESVMDVPVAVTAVSGAALQRYNLDSTARIVEAVPFVNTATSGTGTAFTIRGVGASTLVDSVLPAAVTLNVDDVQISHNGISSLGFFDVEAVQVLKGPQALFFGKSSTAGAIVINSRNPGDRLEASGRASYEFVADEMLFEGAIGGPVTDTLGIRVAGRFRDSAGYLRNTAQPFIDPRLGIAVPGNEGREPSGREYTGRVTLVWSPSSDFKAVLKVMGSSSRGENEGFGQTVITCPTGTAVVSGFPDPGISCVFNRNTVNGRLADSQVVGTGLTSGALFSKSRSWLASLNMTYTADTFNIASVSAFTDYRKRALDSFGASTFNFVSAYLLDDFQAYQQEVRLRTDFDGPFNLMVGGFYEKTRFDLQKYNFSPPRAPDPATGYQFGLHQTGLLRGETASIFGQISVQPIPEVTIDAGLRYSHDTRSISDFGYDYVHPAVTFTRPANSFLSGRMSDSNVNPEATITYRPSDGLMMYAAYKTGYKSGGFGAPAIQFANAGLADATFLPEKVKGGEVGIKADLLGRTLQIQLTAYTYGFSNLQTVVTSPLTASAIYGNAAGARSRGFEAEIQWRATPELTLTATGGYSRARFTSFPAANCYGGQTLAQGCSASRLQDLTGERLPYSSDFAFNGGFTYQLPVGTYRTSFYGNLNYQSAQNLSALLIPGARVGGYARLEGGVRFGPADGPWEIALFGRNLTNRFKPRLISEQAFGLPGTLITNAVTRPREIWIEAGFNF